MVTAETLRGLVATVLPTVVELRRAIHRNPELSFNEFATTQRVATLLSDRGLEPTVRPSGTGLTVDIGTGRRAVGFRADLDALPIAEPPDNPHASQIPGVMHACGHDAHTAIAAGVALILAQLDLPGRVRVIFQPGEESFPGGALTLVQEGVVEELESILAFHVDPGLRSGTVGLRTGAITGSADRFHIRLEGPGGHTARPHQTADLVYAAGKVVTELPTLLDRVVDARRPLVVVFGRIEGGTADNVIPTRLELGGTIRTLDRGLWEEIPFLLENLAEQIVAPTGAKVTVTHQPGIPPVVNDPGLIDVARKAIVDNLGPEAVTTTDVSMGAEDFSRYLEVVPGALLRLGSAPDTGFCDLHSAGFVFNERALEVGLKAATATLHRLLDTAV
ncbi:MAG TPA: amidohydrolase [Acidimicrobiia bacterium]|jgi:amidohydrolase|nr:amidohydrolase [Acidimicrobiia bacterium]